MGFPEIEASEIIEVESDEIINAFELYNANSYGFLSPPNQSLAIEFNSLERKFLMIIDLKF